MNEVLEAIIIEWLGSDTWYSAYFSVGLSSILMLFAGAFIFVALRYVGLPIAKRLLHFFSPSHAQRLNVELNELL